MKIRFDIVSTYEVEYPYETGTETRNEDFDAARKEIEDKTAAVIARALLIESMVTNVAESHGRVIEPAYIAAREAHRRQKANDGGGET